MAIECLASEEIISQGEKTATLTTSRVEGANYYRINSRRFIQYRVNPTPGKRMKPFPQESSRVEIQAEGHKGNINYSIYFN